MKQHGWWEEGYKHLEAATEKQRKTSYHIRQNIILNVFDPYRHLYLYLFASKNLNFSFKTYWKKVFF
jgi:hypothetical protein